MWQIFADELLSKLPVFQTQDDLRLCMDSEWKAPASYNFLSPNPQTFSHLPKEGSREQNLLSAEYGLSFRAGFFPCTCLLLLQELDE